MGSLAPLGPIHAATLVCLGAAASLLVWLARTGGPRVRLAVRAVLVTAMVGSLAFELARASREGWLSIQLVLPLQLCDAALLLAVFSLITLRRPTVTILYFWACSGTAIALLTPDLSLDVAFWEFGVFFGMHGAVVVSALVLVFGFRIRPPAGSPMRVFLATNVYAAVVGLVNLAAGTNYMYLCAKPASTTLLDLMGPWPAYLLVGEAVALVLFCILGLPFRARAVGGGAQG